MKTRLLLLIALFALTPLIIPNVLAMCDAEINYDAKLKSSEVAFTGTVTRLDNYDGPQRVTFFIHDVIKGQVDTPKHVLKNTGMMFLENNAVRSSSVSVNYEIGKTYNVYVENGMTDICTTKLTIPPADYMWEPGPEDGNYYSEKEEILSQQYQDANERKSYRDALSDGSVVLLDKAPKLSDDELDDVMDRLSNTGLDHTELPMASIAIDYQRDILVLWTPDLTIGDKIKAIVGNTAFVLLYEEAPVRWEHDGPPPEPEEPPLDPDNLCPPGKVLDWDICIDECRSGQIERNGVCHNFEDVSITDDKLPWYFLIAVYWPAVVIIALGLIIAIVYLWRKRK